MARRTQLFTRIPWSGGINDAVDPGMLPDNDLVICDNVVFATSGSRLKREAFDYFDTSIPAVTHRSSSGTTRTLVFASSISSGTDEILCVGEQITISGTPSQYATTAYITAISTTTTSNDTITYTATGSLSESSTPTSSLTVVRATAYIALKDYWRTDNSSVKQQLLLAVSQQGKLFKYDVDGNRLEVKPTPQVFTCLCIESASMTTGDYWDFNTPSNAYRVWYDIASGGGTPATGGRTLVEVDVGGSDTAAQVATATQLVLEALGDVTATVNSATVTVTCDASGSATAPADGNAGVTLTVTTTGKSLTQPFSTAITSSMIEVINDVAVITFDGLNNLPIRYRPETSSYYTNLGGSPPDCSVIRVHQSRLFANDKTDKDRLHYSSPGNPEEWLGVGDSGAIDIFPGDSDSDGIIAIHPPFRGQLFVGKGKHFYRLVGDAPENYMPVEVTNGLGSISHAGVATVDLDDQLFLSSRGIHSLAATDQYGDFNAQFLSRKIQNSFKDLVSSRLKFSQGVYIPNLNSVAFSVTENSGSQQNAIYLLHTESREWYRWPDIDCQSVSSRKVNASDNLIAGTSNSRVLVYTADLFADYGTTSYTYRIKTGTIYPGGRPDAWVAFKKIAFFYKPKGNFTFTATIKIDNQPAQALSFAQSTGGDLLGTTFVLGSSRLGSDNVLAPYEQQIDGYGRGCVIEVTSSGLNEQVEIYGFAIEFEPADKAQETIETE